MISHITSAFEMAHQVVSHMCQLHTLTTNERGNDLISEVVKPAVEQRQLSAPFFSNYKTFDSFRHVVLTMYLGTLYI